MILTLTQDEYLMILATVENAVEQKAKNVQRQHEYTVAANLIGDRDNAKASARYELTLQQEFAELQALHEMLRAAEYSSRLPF